MNPAKHNAQPEPLIKPRFELLEPKLKAETLLAMQETEQILDEYERGVRMPKPFPNAREMFTAMALEDEAEGENV